MVTDDGDQTITKPFVDDRQYRHVKLENDLAVLLVQDETADKSAAAVDVHVGQFQDSLPGLAHLVEHMLFMGTEQFPTENELDSFLSSHAGMSNAYTDLEHTVYYMDVTKDHFSDALERFASCFVQPLLSEGAIGREIEAVNSEHGKNKQSDHWRFHQLAKTLMGSAQGHVYGQFGTGNMETLQPQGTAVLQKAVVEFYHRYYKAGRMKVCLVGNHDLDTLETMAKSYFGSVPQDTVTFPELPLLAPKLPLRVDVIPTRETPVLELQWLCRETQSLYRSKPSRALSHLLGHEGPGSLLYILRQERNWVQELYADCSSKSTSIFSIFTMQLELTDAGCERVDEIVSMVYAYIDILKAGIPEWVIDEMQTTSNMQFRFLSKRGPADTASQLASNLQLYSVQDTISGPYLTFEVNMKAVDECLSALRPDNMLLLLAKKEVKTDQLDPYYGTEYSTTDISADTLASWQSPIPVEGLRLPDRNDMLAEDFEIKSTSPDTEKVPVCLIDSPTCRLWYKPDTEFRMPKVNCMLLLRSTLVYESPIQSVLASMWAETAHELCNEFSYAASVAGLYCEFANTRQGIEIHVSGYNDKAQVLLGRILDTVRAFKVDNDLFERIKAKIKQQFQAFLVAQPYQHSINVADRCMEVPKWDIHARLECLEQLTLDDLLYFGLHQVLNRFKLEMLVHGNVTANYTREAAGVVLDKWGPHAPVTTDTPRVVDLPCGKPSVFQFSGWNPQDENSAITNVYQMGLMDDITNVTLSLLHHLVREPSFGQLRTKEQLGYIVHSQVKTNGQCKSLLILIQSETHPAAYLDERIETFWIDFRKTLCALSEDDFQENVKALCSSFLERPKNLSEESSRHWGVITNQTYRFTRLADLAAVAATVTKNDVVRMFDRYILAGSPHRRKLSVQVFGKQHKCPDDSTLRDPTEFAKVHPLLPNRAVVDIQEHLVAQGK